MSDTLIDPSGSRAEPNHPEHSSGGHSPAGPKPGYKTYFAVYAALLALTALTVTSAGLNLGKIAIAIVLAIAGTKSVLVLLYFMHLRYERRLLVRLLVPIVVVTLAIFIGLTYTDILFR